MDEKWGIILQMGLGFALEFFKSLNKPIDEITYEDLKDFRSYQDVLDQVMGKKS